MIKLKLHFCLYSLFFVVVSIRAYSQSLLLMPAPQPREDLAEHSFLAVSYNKPYQLASWATYTLTPEMAAASMAFKPKYRVDPKIPTGTASAKDYKNSGYLMAQLVPVEDILISGTAITETFYMSNIVPQKSGFNKFTWKKMEELFRAWALKGDTLYIVSGPVLTDSPFPTFGANKVSIPSRFYKVAIDLKKQRGIGFVVKSSVTATSLRPYAMSIAEVEAITGITFYHTLPEEIGTKIKSSFNPDDWDFNALN